MAAAPDLNDDRAIETSGVLFTEGGGEPAELTRIKSELQVIAATSEQSGSWLAAAMEASWAMAEALLSYPKLADLLAERHKIIGNNWQNAFTAQLIARCLRRAVQALIRERSWMQLPERERIGAVYDFVRDEIAFGYNEVDDLPASAVLADGYGQCNTKATLLMALLRATGSGCRLHGATIGKRLQKGIMEGLFYRVAPHSIVHSWAEVCYDGRWVGLEGVILDRRYLDGLHASLPVDSGAFCGYAVGTEDLGDPPIAWRGTDTQIQATAVNHDFGVFDDPDSFYRLHSGNIRGIRRSLVWPRMRAVMNRKVASIRAAAAERVTAR